MFSQIAYVNDNHTERVTLRSMLHFALFLFLVIKTKKNSSGDEIANVNFYYDDIAHEFGEITQNKGHYAVQGHSISPFLVPIERSYTTSY